MNIKLASILHESVIDGPGLRHVVFVQGCSRHCQGCHNDDTWNPDQGTLISVEQCFDTLINNDNNLHQGTTFSGGEPFEQAEALTELGKALKAYGHDIVIYTGAYLANLMAATHPATRELLDIADWLIDGPFILAKKDISLKWCGSSNQRIWRKENGVFKKEDM